MERPCTIFSLMKRQIRETKNVVLGNLLIVLPLFLKESLTQVQYIFKQTILLFSSLLQLQLVTAEGKE